jgi:hypothetical protein
MTASPSAHRERPDTSVRSHLEAPQAPVDLPTALARTMQDVLADAALMGADVTVMRAILDDMARTFTGSRRGRLTE